MKTQMQIKLMSTCAGINVRGFHFYSEDRNFSQNGAFKIGVVDFKNEFLMIRKCASKKFVRNFNFRKFKKNQKIYAKNEICSNVDKWDIAGVVCRKIIRNIHDLA